MKAMYANEHSASSTQRSQTQGSRRADRRICGEPHGSTSKQIEERQIDKSTSGSKESQALCVSDEHRSIKACLGLSMATSNRTGNETMALLIEKRNVKETDLFKNPSAISQ